MWYFIIPNNDLNYRVEQKGVGMEPQDLRFHKEHEWIRVEGSKATLGISNFAQDALGDVVFVDVPKVGTSLQAEAQLGEVESTKATSTIYTPVTGKILQVNTELQDHPELLNQDPYGKGWIAVLELANPGEVDGLMTADQYTEFLKSQE
jgi:glycine cleavage system H protein